MLNLIFVLNSICNFKIPRSNKEVTVVWTVTGNANKKYPRVHVAENDSELQEWRYEILLSGKIQMAIKHDLEYREVKDTS